MFQVNFGYFCLCWCHNIPAPCQKVNSKIHLRSRWSDEREKISKQECRSWDWEQFCPVTPTTTDYIARRGGGSPNLLSIGNNMLLSVQILWRKWKWDTDDLMTSRQVCWPPVTAPGLYLGRRCWESLCAIVTALIMFWLDNTKFCRLKTHGTRYTHCCAEIG